MSNESGAPYPQALVLFVSAEGSWRMWGDCCGCVCVMCIVVNCLDARKRIHIFLCEHSLIIGRLYWYRCVTVHTAGLGFLEVLELTMQNLLLRS
jgi:hypothetical protein